MLISMTLSLIQDHSGSAEENNILAMALKFMHDTIVCAHVRFDDLGHVLVFENVCKARLSCFSSVEKLMATEWMDGGRVVCV